MTKKYLAYARVSTKEQEAVDNSIPTQKKIIQEFADRKGYEIIKFYQEAKSGYKKNTNRKEFEEMLNHLAQDEIEGVIFHKVDRSSRNMRDFAKLEKYIDKKRIQIIEGQFDTSKSHGRYMFRMFCISAVFFSENLSEEVSTKMKHSLEQGYYLGSPKVGYTFTKIEGCNRKIQIPNEQASLVKQCFQLYDTGAYSYRALAKEMHKRGMRNTKGNKMSKGSIETLLSESFYYGVFTHGKLGTFKGVHKPIITKALFDRVQARKAGKAVKGSNRHFYTYNHLVRYKSVGIVGERQRGHVYYRVNADYSKEFYILDNGEKRKCVREEFLDGIFEDFFSKIEIHPRFINDFHENIHEIIRITEDDKKNERNHIMKQISLISNRIKNIKTKYWDGKITDEDFNEFRSELEEERDSLYESLKNTEKNIDGAMCDTISDFSNIFSTLKDFSKLSTEKRRASLELFFKKVEVSRGVLKMNLHPEIRSFLDLAKFPILEHQNTASPCGLKGVTNPKSNKWLRN